MLHAPVIPKDHEIIGMCKLFMAPRCFQIVSRITVILEIVMDCVAA